MQMLWSCPKVQEYWNDIHDRLQKITGLVIPFNPLLFILGDRATLEDIAPFLAEWIQTALMLGRRLLIKDWKSASTPAPSHWFSSLGQLAALERLSYRLLDKMDNYDFKWGHYHIHVSGLEGRSQL